ncbi:MAG: hypothetical protein HGA45_31055, partial [Chloroflexales bacterium]|nr:hypothetical protein [Chloroflexales bacterium]
MPQRRVVILGGYGVFGRIIAAQIARLSDVELLIAGRNPAHGSALARQIGARCVRCDLRSPDDLRAALGGAYLAIHAAGPFDSPGHPVARACL